MANPRLVDPTGRRVVVATSKEEVDKLKEQGYRPATKSNTGLNADSANSGAEGNRRSRASSTTEGAERNTGSTTPSS